MNKNIKKLLLLTTMLGLGGAVYSQSYMCMPCPVGTWSDGTTGECQFLDDFKNLGEKVKELEGYSSHKQTLSPGAYTVILRGGIGGMGGGGGYGNQGENYPATSPSKVEAVQYSFILSDSAEIEMYVGNNGGNGAFGHSNADGGGGGGGAASVFKFTIPYINNSVFYLVGNGGAGAKGNHGADCIQAPIAHWLACSFQGGIGGAGGYIMHPSGATGGQGVDGNWAGVGGAGAISAISIPSNAYQNEYAYLRKDEKLSLSCSGRNGCIKLYKLKK